MITFSLGQMSAMVVFEGALSGQMFEGRGGAKCLHSLVVYQSIVIDLWPAWPPAGLVAGACAIARVLSDLPRRQPAPC